MRSAVVDRLIAESPRIGIKRLRRERRQISPLAVEQVETIADAVPERYRAVVVLGAATGLRQAELFGLAVDRVDFLRRSSSSIARW